jgi:hypothetical protein
VIGPLHADATARTARLGGAGIADEQQLGIIIENEQRDRSLEIGNDLAAHADLGAFGPHQERHLVGRQAGVGIDSDRHPARVVGMKTVACVEEQFGLLERP